MKTALLVSFLSFTILTFGNNDRDIIKQIDDVNSSALVLFKNKEIVKSFKEFIIAKTLSDSIQDSYGSAFANYNLGNIYNLMENYESAKEHYFLSLKGAKQIDDAYLVASVYKNLAELYKEEENFEKAHQYFMNALESASNNNSYQRLSEADLLETVQFEVWLNLSELYINKGNFEDALLNLLKVGAYIKSNTVNSTEESFYNYIYGTYYLHKELYNNANIKFCSRCFYSFSK